MERVVDSNVIFSLEWRVVPHSNSMLATADSAVATTMLPSPRTAFIRQLSTNVFPVPPGASRQKRRSELLSLRAATTALKKSRWLVLSSGSRVFAFSVSSWQLKASLSLARKASVLVMGANATGRGRLKEEKSLK